MTEDLRYPIGHYEKQNEVSRAKLEGWIAEIASLPRALRDAVAGLSQEQLDTPYRPEGWTIRQVVHHLADSNMNSYIRLKLALTEPTPTIKPYEEQLWAELPDSALDVEVSLRLLDAVHERWVCLLQALTDEQWQRTLIHPASGVSDMKNHAGLYAWHSNHHLAQVVSLKDRKGW